MSPEKGLTRVVNSSPDTSETGNSDPRSEEIRRCIIRLFSVLFLADENTIVGT